MKCKICSSESDFYDNALILGKYNVDYFKCCKCGFIQTEEPYWIDEAYKNAITDSDIGLIGRNISLSVYVSAILKCFFKDSFSFLDYGGGYGIFVRLMRDNGFNFEWYDKFCDNLFAVGHEKKGNKYGVVTAFELFEHFVDPIESVGELVELGNNVIFSTDLVGDNIKKIDDWWYFAPEQGQHISFYTENAMEELANKFGKKYSHAGSLHIFSENRIHSSALKVCKKLSPIVNAALKRKSLRDEDYKMITGRYPS